MQEGVDDELRAWWPLTKKEIMEKYLELRPGRTRMVGVRRLYARTRLFRAMSGAGAGETITLADGRTAFFAAVSQVGARQIARFVG